MTNLPVNFEWKEGYAVCRLAGRVSLQQAVELAKAAIVAAREQNVGRLLVDAAGLTGFEPPSLTDRYYMAREWADAARGLVRVAMVVQPHLIDPQKFGVTVAANFGLSADVFSSEVQAIDWLTNVQSD